MSLVAGLLLCAACKPAPFYQAYPGPMRAPEAHARIVALPAADGRTRPAISCVDGQREPALEAYVLPGRHYLTVVYGPGQQWSEGALWLDAEAGRTYNVHWTARGGRIQFWLADAETKRLVGGVVGGEPNPDPSARICVPQRAGAPTTRPYSPPVRRSRGVEK